MYGYICGPSLLRTQPLPTLELGVQLKKTPPQPCQWWSYDLTRLSAFPSNFFVCPWDPLFPKDCHARPLPSLFRCLLPTLTSDSVASPHPSNILAAFSFPPWPVSLLSSCLHMPSPGIVCLSSFILPLLWGFHFSSLPLHPSPCSLPIPVHGNTCEFSSGLQMTEPKELLGSCPAFCSIWQQCPSPCKVVVNIFPLVISRILLSLHSPHSLTSVHISFTLCSLAFPNSPPKLRLPIFLYHGLNWCND